MGPESAPGVPTGSPDLGTQDLDLARKESTAYEYLCHLEEAKSWISECLREDLPSAAEFEKTLSNGVFLAKVGHFCAPHVVPYDKIFDINQERWKSTGLHFKHTENINYFLNAVKEIGLPEIFHPETTDIYERKNMPRAIFCLHALSLIMFKLGSAPKIQDLYGRVQFTQQEISFMQEELDRTGVNMPQFKKLGGMLYDGGGGSGDNRSNNIDQHFSSLSQILKSRDVQALLAFLKEPLSQIRDVSVDNIRHYMMVLNSEAKELSRQFTQAEVQGLISRTNLLVALEAVKSEVLAEDSLALLQALRSPALNLADLVMDSNAEMYLTNLMDYVEDMYEHDVLKKATIYEAILMANQLETERNSLEHAIVQVNTALRTTRSIEIVAALKHPALHIPQVYTEAAELYYSSLKLIQEESGADLNYDGIYKPVCFLNLVAETGLAARQQDTAGVKQALAHPDLYIQDLEKNCMDKYADEIIKLNSKSSELLSHGDLQDVVDRINQDNSDQIEVLHGVEAVNSAVDNGGIALAAAMLKLGYKLSKNDEIRMYTELLHIRNNKSRIEETDMPLWLQDIEQAYNTLQELKVEAISVSGALKGVNRAVEFGDANGVISYLFNNWQLLRLNTRPERRDGETILKMLQRKLLNRREAKHSWVIHFFQDGSNVYLDVENGSLSWTAPHCAGEGLALSVGEIRDTVDEVAGGLNQFLEENITKLQARIRGYLVRQRFFDMLDWYDRHTADIIKIQAMWRGKRARKQMMIQLEDDIKERTKALRFLGQLGDSKSIEKQAIVIQRAWRAHKLKSNWQKILDSGFADLGTVVKHIHLLDIKTKDAHEELDLARARGELTKLLRNNEKLEEEVDSMDKKIGLLVQNRISVQEVITEKKKGLTLHRSKSETGYHSLSKTQRGLKALIKESQDRLKAYQQMFYLLQTDPNYVARLMFVSPAPKPKFIETLIFTLYNFGGNRREEYLILKLFRTALRHEIQTKVNSLDEIVKNTPLVLKLVVNYNRYHRNHTLRRLLSPLIQMVMEDKHLKINTSAVDVYKSWISQLESETGQPAGMPYEVTSEVALEYEEVQKRLDRSINSLKRYTKLFLASMVKSKLPYSMLYMAKVLYSCLCEKFPESKEKDLLKTVGNLIYFKYMNPVIISPDRFDMLESKDITLTNEQRRNLAHIAKLLQYSSSKLGFGSENPHMEKVNDFIIECHERLKDYYARCCNVEEPEVEYNIDQYSDAALIAKPNIYISLAEICDTHALLLEHKDSVLPNKGDPMHGILNTLGSASLSAMHGAATEDCGSLTALGRTEVCLVLNAAGGCQMGKDMTDTDRLWVKTKHLLFAILPAVHSSDKQTLIGLLKSRTTPDQEDKYNEILDFKEQEFEASRHKDLEVFDIFCDDEGRLPLEDAKRLVLKNLRILEVEGYTSSKDGCQSIITDIAKDIFNQREHRLNRRRELTKMRINKSDLLKKKNYMLDQLEKYRLYTLQCLANMNKAGNNKRVHFATLKDDRADGKGRKIRNKSALKYSATKLYDKGVLYTIEGLPPSQLKNVQFVFLPLEEEGRFQISARFMGVDVESVSIDIQELLKLQYEGVSVTDMFGKAKINVNLLLYFLNTKFYGR